jgi:hypothetical protein
MDAATTGRGARVVLPGQAPDGTPILSVLLKRTFEIVSGGTCTLAEQDRPLLPGDQYWDDPATTSVRYESDFIPYKPGTDVVLDAVAYAPGGAPSRGFLASLQLNKVKKQIAVIGDRVARYVANAAPSFSEPAPFTRMELRYERAYGGTDVYSDPKCPYPYPRNPLGRGFVVRNTPKSVDGLALPSLEDPAELLSPTTLCLEEYGAWENRQMPVGFGWFPKPWIPRALLAGIMPGDRATEQQLRNAYAELLSGEERDAYLKHGIRDMDFHFFNGASAGFAFPYLTGGEWIGAENLTPDGRIYFQLPEERPRLGLDVGEGVREAEVALHTVQIRMEDRQVDLVWRGAVPYSGMDWLPEMKRLEIFVA